VQAFHGCPDRPGRFLAFLLVATLAVLPSIDAWWCPDGCREADSVQLSMHGRSASPAGSCGLCLNGVAVNGDVRILVPVSHAFGLEPVLNPAPVLGASSEVDRPPRL